jgi:hypothetical protein
MVRVVVAARQRSGASEVDADGQAQEAVQRNRQ